MSSSSLWGKERGLTKWPEIEPDGSDGSLRLDQLNLAVTLAVSPIRRFPVPRSSGNFLSQKSGSYIAIFNMADAENTLRIFVVDAFTDKPFGGNPAAVCLVGSKVSRL